MTTQLAIVLGLLFVALILFATERVPIDIVSLILVLLLVVTGTLSAGEAFAGFGNDIVITIAGLFILTGGLAKTGVIDAVGRRLQGLAGNSEIRMAGMVMIVAALCAAFMKNTTTTAIFLPVVLGIALRKNIHPSKLLMPLAFGAILGGTCTLIGTSTNLAVSGAMTRYGLAPFSMFELTSVGVPIVAVGLLYMLIVGLRLLPNREGDGSLTEQYHVRQYMSEVLVLEGSRMIGKRLAEAPLSDELDLTVVGILRGGKSFRIAPNPDEEIQEGDLLLVQGRIDDILRVKGEAGIEIKADFELSDTILESADANVELFEAMIPRGSDFNRQNLKRLKFQERYQLVVLAINRHGINLLSKMSSVKLRFGDVLLLQGRREHAEQLAADSQVLLLEEISNRQTRSAKKSWALVASQSSWHFRSPTWFRYQLPSLVACWCCSRAVQCGRPRSTK